MEGPVSGHLHTFVVHLKKKKKTHKSDWKVDFNEEGLEKAEGFKLFIDVILHQ